MVGMRQKKVSYTMHGLGCGSGSAVDESMLDQLVMTTTSHSSNHQCGSSSCSTTTATTAASTVAAPTDMGYYVTYAHRENRLSQPCLSVLQAQVELQVISYNLHVCPDYRSSQRLNTGPPDRTFAL